MGLAGTHAGAKVSQTLLLELILVRTSGAAVAMRLKTSDNSVN